MTIPSKRAINAYVQTGIETGVPEADAHRLVLMLFDGALAAVADARIKLRSGDIAGRGMAISKAIAIVDEGLRASLDPAKGGEIASRLEGLYRYVCSKLLEANLKSQVEPLEEVSSLLNQLQSAWTAIAPRQAEAAHA